MLGITEPYWKNATEELKFCWAAASRGLAILMGFLIVTKTGVSWIDVPVTILTGMIPLTVVSSQRSLSRFKPHWRRRILRASVVASLHSVTILGLAVFLSLCYGLVRGVVLAMPFPRLAFTHDDVLQVLLSVIVLFALIKAPLNVFRGLDLENLIRHQPKSGLIALLSRRRMKTADRLAFMHFELGIYFLSYLYGSGALFAVQMIQSTA